MKFFHLLFFIILPINFSAQENLVDQLYPLQQNPTLKEKVYVHTNKTSFTTDDTIWFKAYVGDTLNLPSIETNKLYVNLLDGEGSEISSRIVRINDGTGVGEFELNTAVIPGTYYIEAYTNFMRNFGDDYHYLQEVVIGNLEPKPSTSIKKVQYDLQLLPEGGHLLEGIQNTIGIKALVNGKGIDFSGIIKNCKGDVITKFSNQHMGMSKCEFVYKTDETYSAVVSINDTILQIEVPKAIKKGIALHVDNFDENYLEVVIRTNEATFFDQVYSNYTLLYHQDHRIFDVVRINRIDSLTGTIRSNKNLFSEGVHTVTLFEANRPIAERKFFIENNSSKATVSFEKLGIENDSLNFKVITQTTQNSLLKSNISISVLEGNSTEFEEKQHLRSAFLLTPFLGGYVENPAYYFNEKNPNRKEHIDLLLLTQGWARYNLAEMISELKPEPQFEFEYGFELRGKLKILGKHNTLALFTDDYKVIEKVKLKEGLDFKFSNLLFFKGDTTKVAYLNWLGKVIKPDGVSYDTILKKTRLKARIPKRGPIEAERTTAIFQNLEKTSSTTTDDDINVIIPANGTIALDEVILTEKKRSEKYLKRRKLIEKYKPLVFDIGAYYDLPIPEVFTNYDHDLLSYLRGNQAVNLNDTNFFDPFLEAPGKPEVIIFIDGRLIEGVELLSISLAMKDVANIMNSGNTYQVFTTDAYRNNTIELFDKYIVTDGFDRGKTYYAPIYSNNPEENKTRSEIDWKPMLETNKKGEVFFKISKTHEDKILLFSIQGFSNDGHLLSETILLE